MKKMLSALLALTTAVSFTACKKNDTDQKPEQKETVAVYLPSEKVSYTDDGEVFSKTTYEYDSAGRLLTITAYTPTTNPVWSEEEGVYIADMSPGDDQPDVIEQYTYDDQGNVTSYTSRHFHEGVWEEHRRYTYSYTYGDDKQITAYRTFFEQSDTEYRSHKDYTVEYEDGKVVRLFCKDVDAEQEPQLIGQFSYGENNQLSSCKLTEFGSNDPFQYSFTYNEQNRLAALAGSFDNGEPPIDLRFSYDGNGNLCTEECVAPAYLKGTVSYSYKGNTLTDVNCGGEKLIELDDKGCAIRPVGEDYEYHYTALELSKEDAEKVRYGWNQYHEGGPHVLRIPYSDQWSPYFVAVKHPAYEIGPMLPYCPAKGG